MTRRAASILVLAVAMWLITTSGPASAHFATIAYSTVVVDDDGAVQWDLYLDPYHIAGFFPLDRNEDGYVTSDEVTASRTGLANLARTSIAVSGGGGEAPVRLGEIALVEAGPLELPQPWRPPEDFPLVHIDVEFDTDAGGETALSYRLFDLDGVEDHQNIAVVSTPHTEYLHVFDPDAATLTLAEPAASRSAMPVVSVVLAGAGGAVVGVVILAVHRRHRHRRHQDRPAP